MALTRPAKDMLVLPTAMVGEVRIWAANSAPSGWLILDGSTIGDVASGATLANAAHQALFQFLWDNIADANAPVSGGRGVSAAADWTAGKTIRLPDARGRDIIGASNVNLPNGAAGGAITTRALGDSGGAETHVLAIGEIPAHTHGYEGAQTQTNMALGGSVTASLNSAQQTGSAGGGAAHNNMAPFLALNLIIATGAV